MGSDRSAVRWFGRVACLALAVFSLLMLPSLSAFGQVDEGAISGTVTDSTGAVVPNAKVVLLNTDQGIQLQSVTGTSGEYSFSPVRIGNYSVTVSAPGFSATTQQHITVAVSQQVQVNVQLTLGEASQTVEVTTAPPQLQTADASVGQVIGEKSVNSLPLNGRNFTFLAQLGAGVNTPQADTRGNAASGAFSANGLRPAQNNYLLDGIDNNSNAVDFLNGTNFIILPPVDAIQEFKVQTANFSAEFGRSAGAVLNASIKSGTNSIHGAVWEFFRNDKLDAADYFETTKKGELRQNQFGASIGGPILKNKIFYFGDYEGLRRVQGNTASGVSVPTVAERASGYSDLSDIIGGTARADALGRMIIPGVVLDPATTRPVTAGVVDPVTGLISPTTGYVRDPFGLGTCTSTGLTAPTVAACPGLNQLPAARIDPNAVKLLNLFPNPLTGGPAANYQSSPNLFEHRNQFDVRGDYDISEKDQVFVRFSYEDDPNFIPGPFTGVADGGSFQQGLQTAKSSQSVAGFTHVFTPTAINVVHAGFNHLHTTRFGPEGGTMGIPEQYGIQGIPQVSENGGLPAISISGLSTLGSNSYLPSDEVSQTLQLTDDFTKTYGKHSFKTGIEYQLVKFNTLQPAYSRGTFSYNSNSSSVSFTDIPNVGGGATGKAQFLLTPEAATVANGVDYVGGSDQIQASNISKTYDLRYYLAGYFQDDWKITPKLTLNLGLRWDYFSPISETNGGQANFVQDSPPNGVPTYLIPASGKDDRSLSSTANNPALAGNGFLDLLAKDGIAVELTDKYGKGLVQTQKTNLAPRLGFAYQATPKLVARGGFGLSYNAYENQGYGPNLGENYPFVFNFNYAQANLPGYIPSVTPISASTPWAGCGTAGPGGVATLSSGFSCIGFTPLAVNGSGLGLQGLQFNYKTPRTLSSNLALQYSITRTLSIQAAYVLTNGTNLQAGIGNNQVSQILPASASTSAYVPFPDFGHGGSYQRTIGRSVYNGGLLTLEQQFDSGLNFLFTYTWSKTLSDAGDLLNGGNTGGYRAPYVPGAGIKYDWGPADFDIRNVFHASGGYELPFGKGKRFAGNSSKLADTAIGGWSLNWIATLEGGQPITLSCPSGPTAGTGCFDVRVPGQSQKLGLHKDSNGQLNWFGNPGAFQQPCLLGTNGAGAVVPVPDSPAGCVPLSGLASLGGGLGTTTAPGVTKFDLSLFKSIPINERFSMQFRAEMFNILNHPNFNAPGFGGNGVVAISNSTNFTSSNFGEIGSTRDAPYDPRQIQFALKLYY